MAKFPIQAVECRRILPMANDRFQLVRRLRRLLPRLMDDGGIYQNGGSGAGVITLSGLTSGHSYLVQVFSYAPDGDSGFNYSVGIDSCHVKQFARRGWCEYLWRICEMGLSRQTTRRKRLIGTGMVRATQLLDLSLPVTCR